MCHFAFTLLPAPLFKVGSGGPLSEKVRQYPAFKDKKMTWYLEKPVVSNSSNACAKDLEFIGNGKTYLILYFTL